MDETHIFLLHACCHNLIGLHIKIVLQSDIGHLILVSLLIKAAYMNNKITPFDNYMNSDLEFLTGALLQVLGGKLGISRYFLDTKCPSNVFK